MDAPNSSGAIPESSTKPRPPRGPPNNRRPRGDRQVGAAKGDAEEEKRNRPHPPRNRRPIQQDNNAPSSSANEGESSSASAPKHQRSRRRPNANNAGKKEGDEKTESGPSQAPSSKRRAQFNPSLTTSDPSSPSTSNAHRGQKPHTRRRPNLKEPVADDLTSNLTYTLSTPPYPDCPICFASIHPAQPTWSGSPSPGESSASCCWTPFHLKCIRSWASKSVKEVEAAMSEAEGGGADELLVFLWYNGFSATDQTRDPTFMAINQPATIRALWRVIQVLALHVKSHYACVAIVVKTKWSSNADNYSQRPTLRIFALDHVLLVKSVSLRSAGADRNLGRKLVAKIRRSGIAVVRFASMLTLAGYILANDNVTPNI
ncbi:hypothetical protein ONZ45_g3311 [Pleurotus djamor]|nr:hypothetical protein ONZ45_g3311 [Pleurotus djamor]